MSNDLVVHLSFSFFLLFTKVNAHLGMKYFLNKDDIFMNFRKSLAKVLIENFYINKKTCGSPENTRKRKISHTLETVSTHATEYNFKIVFHRKI